MRTHDVLKQDGLSEDPADGCGVLYAAFGESYVAQANRSAVSVKRFCPDLPVTIVTNLPGMVDRSVVDEVLEAPHSEQRWHQRYVDRLLALARTPYERTLALDADTLLLDDVQDIFTVLAHFDVVVCHEHHRAVRHDRYITEGRFTESMPYAFCELQIGVMGYNRSPTVLAFLDELLERYRAAQHRSDQAALRETLWENRDIRFFVLPPEYNFNSVDDIHHWSRIGYKEARPKILHYTRHKRKGHDLDALLAPYLAPSGDGATRWRRPPPPLVKRAWQRLYRPVRDRLSNVKRRGATRGTGPG